MLTLLASLQNEWFKSVHFLISVILLLHVYRYAPKHNLCYEIQECKIYAAQLVL